LERIRDRIHDTYRAAFGYSKSVIDAIAQRCTESESGARNIENVLARGVLPEISARCLARLASGEPIVDIEMSLDKSGAFSYRLA
jgi:type VI secretion system protein VasG